MGGVVSLSNDNYELVDKLTRENYLRSSNAQRIFRAVDRGDYFLPFDRERAYVDIAWKNGFLHISAPCVYCDVVENLMLKPGLSFLNLGSGTGYLSTMAGLILGANGINHGIEIHESVVKYARGKLDKFIRTSPAIDEFDFCRPEFVVGNCLRLSPDAQLYDRVYCGAACPKEHLDYMKKLIKIGGILVLPLDDFLVQIKRISENEWENKEMVRVKFTTLISPSEGDDPDMPDAAPATLQEFCRSIIRRTLLEAISHENPEITKALMRTRMNKKKQTNTPKSICISVLEPDYETDDYNRVNIELGSRNLQEMNNLIRLVTNMRHLRRRVHETVSRVPAGSVIVLEEPSAANPEAPSFMNSSLSSSLSSLSSTTSEELESPQVKKRTFIKRPTRSNTAAEKAGTSNRKNPTPKTETNTAKLPNRQSEPMGNTFANSETDDTGNVNVNRSSLGYNVSYPQDNQPEEPEGTRPRRTYFANVSFSSSPSSVTSASSMTSEESDIFLGKEEFSKFTRNGMNSVPEKPGTSNIKSPNKDDKEESTDGDNVNKNSLDCHSDDKMVVDDETKKKPRKPLFGECSPNPNNKETNSQNSQENSSEQSDNSGARKRPLFPRKGKSDTDKCSSDNNSDSDVPPEYKLLKKSTPTNVYDINRKKLSSLMQNKVQMLPLPPYLIRYVNMNRVIPTSAE